MGFRSMRLRSHLARLMIVGRIMELRCLQTTISLIVTICTLVMRSDVDSSISLPRAEIAQNADHFSNVDVTRRAPGGSLPNWAEDGIANHRVTVVIGRHTFLNLLG